MEWLDFCDKVFEILEILNQKFSFTYDEEKISYVISSCEYSYTKEEYYRLKEAAEKFKFQPFSISDEKRYESLVELPNRDSRTFYMMRVEEELLGIKLESSEITYSFKKASNELVWYLIKDYPVKSFNCLKLGIMRTEIRIRNLPEKDLFSILRFVIHIPFSILIETKNNESIDVMQEYQNSYLFNLAYNFDLVFKPVTEFEELFPQRFFFDRRKICDVNELAAPQLLYKKELVEQYYMALISADPFVKFIGFYHIMEHFYDEVYNEDIFKSVQGIIQHPGFSAKRKKDIVKIVDLIKNKTREAKQEFQGSELEALELTLRKFVDITELTNHLKSFDSSSIDYYKSNQVSFSGGDMVDLIDITNDKLYKKLASRIYKTRNALVHNKSNEGRLKERGIYNPFKDKPELLKEIPLMRYISEEIIIHSSSAL